MSIELESSSLSRCSYDCKSWIGLENSVLGDCFDWNFQNCIFINLSHLLAYAVSKVWSFSVFKFNSISTIFSKEIIILTSNIEWHLPPMKNVYYHLWLILDISIVDQTILWPIKPEIQICIHSPIDAPVLYFHGFWLLYAVRITLSQLFVGIFYQKTVFEMCIFHGSTDDSLHCFWSTLSCPWQLAHGDISKEVKKSSRKCGFWSYLDWWLVIVFFLL